MSYFRVLSISLLITLFSCSVDEPSEPRLRLGLRAFTTMGSVASGRLAHGVVTFQEVKAGVTSVELETSSIQDDPNLEAEYEGAYLVDLLSGASTPDLGTVKLVPGSYDKLELTLSPVAPGGSSLFIRFIHAQDQFELSTARGIGVEVEGLVATGLSGSARLVDLLVLVDLDMLFAGISLDALVPGSDGVVRIDDQHNTEVLEAILENLGSACEAGEDSDRDGELDD